jgi:hypothetical protein
MPKPQPRVNRHHYRVWIKWAIESGLLEKLPPLYDLDGIPDPETTEEHARRLLAELRDPDASRRRLPEILADARRFKAWVEARRKDGLQAILRERRPDEPIFIPPRREPQGTTGREPRPFSARRVDPDPRSDPMWDEWLDARKR